MTTVTEHLRSTGTPLLVLPHEPTPTAAREARTLGVDPGQVAKALLLDVADGHACAIITADRRLDLHRVARVLGARAELAREDELIDDFPDFELGGFPAVPALLDMPVVVDLRVVQHPYVVMAAGSIHESVEVPTSVFEAPNVEIAMISRLPSVPER